MKPIICRNLTGQEMHYNRGRSAKPIDAKKHSTPASEFLESQIKNDENVKGIEDCGTKSFSV